LAGILLFEAVLLHTTARDFVAPFYPSNYDQIQYLTESYLAYDVIRQHGLLEGVLDVLRQPRAQGMLLQFQAAVLFLITGPSRLAALDLNVGYFLVYLGVTAEAVRRSAGMPAALASLGLIASAATNTHVGGIFDFRLDFAAMCLWGTLLALVVLGVGRNQSRPKLIAAVAMVAALLVLTRIITVAYVAVSLGGLFLIAPLIRTSPEATSPTPSRRALLPALTVSALATGWFVLQNWTTVIPYYIVGHVASDEKHIRALEVGATNLIRSLSFYPNSLVYDHAGPAFLRLTVALAIAGVLGGFLSRGGVSSENRKVGHTLSLGWVACALTLCIAGPYIVLTANEAKSVVVGDVLLPPLVLAIVCVFSVVSRLTQPVTRVAHYTLIVATSGVLLLGLRAQWSQVRDSESGRRDLATASQLMQDVGDYVLTTRSGQAVWAMDGHLDFTAPLVTRLYYFEQRRVWLALSNSLGAGAIHTTLSEDEVVQSAAAADVLILTRGGTWMYPYDHSIERVKPSLFALAKQQYLLLHEYRVYGRDVFVYIRPLPPVVGASDPLLQ
jgi:hypothetical protein